MEPASQSPLPRHEVSQAASCARFVVDFYCASLDWVIEIDGAIHDRMEQRDKGRSELLEQFGGRILRIRNEHVTALHLRELLLPHVPPSPLRRGGPGG